MHNTSPPHDLDTRDRARSAARRLALLPFVPLLLTGAASAQWVTFENGSDLRIVADAGLVASDTEEKDYAWGDVDMDGDVDLVVVRKEPFTNDDGLRNVLLINEGLTDGREVDGILVDRTTEFVLAADDGGSGFLDETNDRDVQLVDVDLDGWLDIVTATAYGQGLPKSFSHARVYLNLGEVDGVWQGFEYQAARTPQMVEAPNTCAVAAGDVNGDDYPDLYYVSYNSTVLEDHLLVNRGDADPGVFDDESFRLPGAMLLSDFGTNGVIADMNGDGFADIVKSEDGPVKIFYNNGAGVFDQLDPVSSSAHYHVTVGHLNDDGLPDLVISDDAADRYLLNLGPGGDGAANFGSHTFSFVGGGFDDTFGSNSVTADLNNDERNDVLIADVDVDSAGCARRMHIYRNLGNPDQPTLQEEQIGGTVANIPTGMLQGTHDVAVLDLDRDGWLDLVIGRCSGTQIWMNSPPLGIIFTYPGGLPVLLPPDQPFELDVQVQAVGDATIVPESGRMFLSIDGGPFGESSLADLGGDLLRATFPPLPCTSEASFYFAAEISPGGEFSDPVSAPGAAYLAVSALGQEVAFEDQIEGDVSGWATLTEGIDTSGAWEQAEPVPSFFGGDLAAPAEDGTPGHDPVQAFITQNGTDPAQPGEADVDNGPVRLISPPLDLEGTVATISFARWFFSDGGQNHVPDFLTVEVSPDGGDTWVPVPELTTGGTGSVWETVSFQVDDYVEPTAEVRVRFTTSDLPNNSVTEAGIDDLRVEVLVCDDDGTPCPTDLDGNGETDVSDLVDLILDWGCLDPPGPCPGDVDGSGEVDVSDLVTLILGWGPCG